MIVFVQNRGLGRSMLVALFTSWLDSALLSLTSLIWGTSAAVTSSLGFLMRGVLEKCFMETKEGDCCYSKAGICLRLDLCAIYHGLSISLLPPSITLCTLAKKNQGGPSQQTLLFPSHLPKHHRVYPPMSKGEERLTYLLSTAQFRAVQQTSFR